MFLRVFRASAVRRQVDLCDSPSESVTEEVADEWVCGSDPVKRTGRYGSFLGCSHYPGCHDTQPFKIDRQGHPVVTARLRSSIKRTRSRRSRDREEATSLGGLSVQAARPFTWWKQPGGSLTLPTRLNRLQPRAVRPIGSPEDGPSRPADSGRRALTSSVDPVVNVVAQLRPRFPKTGTHRQDAFRASRTLAGTDFRVSSSTHRTQKRAVPLRTQKGTVIRR
jgi:ssDNA-binding Zn-finger/Zn-ribbon topoisomerase 1